ncbi:MAG: hypothetical protein JW751_17575 [Polyangiaceae bacterium]|nr:hypothetical protein [Polyangiaceae bacterium]
MMTAARRIGLPLAINLVALVALFGGAFVAAPYGCAGGTSAYVFGGIGVVLLVMAVPIVFGRRELGTAIGLAGLSALVGLTTWISGFFLADLPVICALF